MWEWEKRPKDLFDSIIARLIGFHRVIAARNLYKPAADQTNLGIPTEYVASESVAVIYRSLDAAELPGYLRSLPRHLEFSILLRDRATCSNVSSRSLRLFFFFFFNKQLFFLIWYFISEWCLVLGAFKSKLST